MNLTALTPCCVDYYLQLNRSFLGGNSLNVASMWKTMAPQATISVITAVGDDAHGDFQPALLSEGRIFFPPVRGEKHYSLADSYKRARTITTEELLKEIESW